MIIAENKVETQGNIVFADEVKMGFHDSASAFLVNNLIKQYADPYLASLREYTSNARDAHKESGQTRPVEVSFPDTLAPNLIIEDFGVGLSREELKGFGQFGASTKRDSNDYVGGFGLGSKSGLAMASQFSVTSVKGGKRNTVVIRRDESGAPSMGFLAEQDVDASVPNGTKITIPTSERGRFIRAVDSGFFYGWERGSILIDGEEPPVSIFDTTHYTPVGDAGWRSVTPASQRSYNDQSRIKALVGPVAYTLDLSQIQEEGLVWRNKEQYLRNLVVKLDNGSVEIHPSRESLIYDKRTRAAIAARLRTLIEAGKAEFQKDIDNATSPRDAVLAIIRAEREGFEGPYDFKGRKLKFESKVSKPKVLDSRLWTANIVRSSRSNSGYGADIRYNSYRALTSRTSEVYAFYQSQSVLVWGIEEPSNVTGKPKELSGAATFAEVMSAKAGVPVTDFRIVFTTRKAKTLDTFFTQGFAKVLHVDDYAAIVKAERQRLAALTRASNKAAGLHTGVRGTGIKKDEVRVLNYSSNGYSTTTNTAVDKLDGTKTHVLIKNGEGSLFDSIRVTVMNQSGNGRSGYLDTLIDVLDKTGRYVFIIANANTNTSKYADEVPNLTTDIGAIILKEAELVKSGLSDMDKWLYQQINSGTTSFFMADHGLTPAHVAELHDPRLVKFIEAVDSYSANSRAVTNRLRTFSDIVSYLQYTTGQTPVDRTKLAIDSPPAGLKVPDFEVEYPMLASPRSYYRTAFKPEAVVQYVNVMFDARAIGMVKE